MGGKSTFLRQNAIIAIMAQMGAFVPASHCEMGVIDAVYSRASIFIYSILHQCSMDIKYVLLITMITKYLGRFCG